MTHHETLSIRSDDIRTRCSSVPFGSFLPGTELLQSPFRMEFSMGSLSLRYCQSLWRYCQFLQSYRRSLQRYHQSLGVIADPCGVVPIPEKHKPFDATISALHAETSAQQHWCLVQQHRCSVQRHQRSACDIGAHLEFLLISAPSFR